MPFAGSMNIQASFGGITANNIDSGTATDGQVLTADGAGGAAWENAAGGSAAYLVYVALLTQTGENAPVATVLENTLGGSPVWTRENVGYYLCTLAGAFPSNKTVVSIRALDSVSSGGNSSSFAVNGPDTITVEAGNMINQEGLDELLYNCPIEIRVYP